MKTLSFKALLNRSWLELLSMIGVATFFTLTFAMALIAIAIQGENASYIASHLLSSIKPELQVNDHYEIRRKLNGLMDRSEILAIQLSTSAGLKIESVGKSAPENVGKMLENVSRSSWVDFIFSPVWMYSSQVKIFDDELLTIKFVHRNKEIVNVIRLNVLVFFLLMFALAIFFLLRSRHIISKLTNPIEELANYIGCYPETKDQSNQTFMKIDETREAAQKFITTFDSLRQKERAEIQYKTIAQANERLLHDAELPHHALLSAVRLIKQAKNIEDLQQMQAEVENIARNNIQFFESLKQETNELAGKATIEISDVSINNIINLSIKHIFPKADQTIELTCTTKHKYSVRGDNIKLVRALSNILTNAVKAMGHDGEIWIKTSEKRLNDKIFIYIELGNSGTYISPEIQEKIFQAYYSDGSGKGLGLAIVNKIVSEHGGTVHCQSSKIEGTKFVVSLPSNSSLFDNEEKPPRHLQLCGKNSSSVDKKLAVAVIEDDDFIRRAWEASLTEAKVHSFTNPESFLTFIDTGEHFDCIITDYYFDTSEQTAKQIAEKAKQKYPGVSVFVSSVRFPKNVSPDLFSGVLGKEPFSTTQLQQKIKKKT